MDSGDYDPNYLLLRYVFDKRDYTKWQRLEHIFCFLCTSHIGSGELLYQRVQETGRIGDTTNVVKNTQRRGFRGNNDAAKFFNASQQITVALVESIVNGYSPEDAWINLRRLFENLPQAGPYHSFKFCDLLKYTMGYKITSPDVGVGGASKSAGPIPGLERLTGKTWKQCATDIVLQKFVYRKAKEAGVPFPGMEEFETCLCDFDKFMKGRYYVGANLDGQMDHLKGIDKVYWEGRRAIFPTKYLGELGGWFGERKELRGRNEGRLNMR